MTRVKVGDTRKQTLEQLYGITGKKNYESYKTTILIYYKLYLTFA